MTSLPSPPSVPPRRARVVDFALVREDGELTPTERAKWEPHRVRLVREGWLLSGAIGFVFAVGQTASAIIHHPATTFGVGSVLRIFAGTVVFGGVCGFSLVRSHVTKKRSEFVRSTRLRDLMLRDGDPP